MRNTPRRQAIVLGVVCVLCALPVWVHATGSNGVGKDHPTAATEKIVQATHPASAQLDQSVSVLSGAHNGLLIGVRYDVAIPSPNVTLGAELHLFPYVISTGGGIRFVLDATQQMTLRDAFGLSYSAGVYLSRSHDEPIRFHAIGLSARVRPGYYSNRFVAAIEAEGRTAALTHVNPSARFYETFDGLPGVSRPQRGWYAFTAVEFPVGLYLRANAGERFFFDLRGGVTFQPTAQDIFVFPQIGIVPFYGYLRTGWNL